MAVLRSRLIRLAKIVRVAPRALMSHKLRSALSIVGIVCGVMAVLSMISIGEGARKEALRQIEQLGTRNIYLKAIELTEGQKYKARRMRSAGLSRQDADLLKGVSDAVSDVGCLRQFSAAVSGAGRDISPQFVACSANLARLQNLSIRSGRFINDRDVDHRNKVCVLGSSVIKRLGSGAWLGSHIRVGQHLFRIVGILRHRDYSTKDTAAISMRNYNEMVLIPLGLENLVSQIPAGSKTADSGLTELIVQIVRTNQVISAAAVLQRAMEVAHHGVKDFQMVVPQQLLKQAQKTRRMFNIILGTIAGISLLVGGIGIMNIMLATVSERTREIGIRRAVGATRRHIAIQFLAEAVILTFCGGVVGIFAGIGAVWLITAVAGWQAVVTTLAVCLPLSMAIMVGIFFGMYPAYRAAHMNPIAALHHG